LRDSKQRTGKSEQRPDAVTHPSYYFLEGLWNQRFIG